METWENNCYSNGIPDEVPNEIQNRNLAPSYKAIAIALLKNDMQLTSIGFSATYSDWYGVLKRESLMKEKKQIQLMLF